jgi:hypothetical protein
MEQVQGQTWKYVIELAASQPHENQPRGHHTLLGQWRTRTL